jgi:hypothetical protein
MANYNRMADMELYEEVKIKLAEDIKDTPKDAGQRICRTCGWYEYGRVYEIQHGYHCTNKIKCIAENQWKPKTPILEECESKTGWHGEEKSEAVEHPAHYTAYPVEVIDIIKLALEEAYGPDGFKAYCLGNEIKYRMRAGLKGDTLEDIKKAMKYKEFRGNDGR